MKINYKPNNEKEIAEAGDLIQFQNKVIGLILSTGDITLLKNSNGDDWFGLDWNRYKEDFAEGKYKIIAKKDKWEINILE